MCCQNISVMETVITSHHHWVEIHSLLCLWLRNSTKHNSAKSSTYMNHVQDFSREASRLYDKTNRFLSRNQQFLSSSLIITLGKRSFVKDLNKLKILIIMSKDIEMVPWRQCSGISKALGHKENTGPAKVYTTS